MTTTHTVTSADGTTIGYQQLGEGPGLIVLHGAMESATSHRELAEALASTFTVHLVDRRGRGMTGPHRPDHCLRTDVEDLDAVLRGTGAHLVVGVSSGALVTLEAAMTLPAVHRVAIFEPPLLVDGSASTAWLARYDAEMARGDVSAAMVTGMLGAQMGPPIFRFFPRRVLVALTTRLMAVEDRKAAGADVPMRALAPTLHYDGALAAELQDQAERFRALPVEALLLGGAKSPDYLKRALDALEQVLPRAERVEFAGVGHGASGNANRGGRPQPVADAIRRFFTRPMSSSDGRRQHGQVTDRQE